MARPSSASTEQVRVASVPERSLALEESQSVELFLDIRRLQRAVPLINRRGTVLPTDVRSVRLRGKVVTRFEIAGSSALGPVKQNDAETESQLRSSVVDMVAVCLEEAFL